MERLLEKLSKTFFKGPLIAGFHLSGDRPVDRHVSSLDRSSRLLSVSDKTSAAKPPGIPRAVELGAFLMTRRFGRNHSVTGSHRRLQISSRIAVVSFHRRPVGTDRQRRRSEFGKVFGGVDNSAADDRQPGFELLDLLFGNREVIRGEHTEIGQLPGRNRTLLSVFG